MCSWHRPRLPTGTQFAALKTARRKSGPRPAAKVHAAPTSARPPLNEPRLTREPPPGAVHNLAAHLANTVTLQKAPRRTHGCNSQTLHTRPFSHEATRDASRAAAAAPEARIAGGACSCLAHAAAAHSRQPDPDRQAPPCHPSLSFPPHPTPPTSAGRLCTRQVQALLWRARKRDPPPQLSPVWWHYAALAQRGRLRRPGGAGQTGGAAALGSVAALIAPLLRLHPPKPRFRHLDISAAPGPPPSRHSSPDPPAVLG